MKKERYKNIKIIKYIQKIRIVLCRRFNEYIVHTSLEDKTHKEYRGILSLE